MVRKLVISAFAVCLCLGFELSSTLAASAGDTIALIKTDTGGLHFESSKIERSKLEQRKPPESRHGLEEGKIHETLSRLKSQAEKPFEHNSYVTHGLIKLLFDNVTEPFTLYYDGENHRSRVDYGISRKVRTLQLGGDVNKLFRIEFPTRETPTERTTCIEMRGTRERPVRAQIAVPLLDKFERVGSEQIDTVNADRWKYDVVEEDRSMKHTFTLFTEPKTRKPVRLEVISRNTKSGLIVDRYEIDYKRFINTRPTEDVFQVPSDVHCRSIVGNEVETGEEFMSGLRRQIREEHEEKETRKFNAGGRKEERQLSREEVDRERLYMNPIASLIDPDDHIRIEHETDRLFENYRRFYNKKYENENEFTTRRAAFCHNFRYVNLMNRAGLSYKLRINHLADRTNDELRKMLGFRRTKISETAHGQAFDSKRHNIRGIDHIPTRIDWRLLGAVTPVVDQGECGSDWAISATSVVESALFLRTNRLTKLSAQELLDCSHEHGNRDCNGGEDFRAYEYILSNGLASETTYGPLSNRKGECRSDTSVSAKIKHWVLVSPNDEYELKRAVAMNGPVAVAMDASHKSFFFYASGIYHEPNCRSQPSEANHAVLVVGYGELNGRDYFIVQNSFSTEWGQNGYMLIESAMNHCGLLNTPTFVTCE